MRLRGLFLQLQCARKSLHNCVKMQITVLWVHSGAKEPAFLNIPGVQMLLIHSLPCEHHGVTGHTVEPQFGQT